MKRRRLPFARLATFVAVADSGGFTAAARRLGVPTSLVGQDVSKLEEQLGSELFVRTTRRVYLTEGGERLLEECKPFLDGLVTALDRVNDVRGELTGTLRVTTVPEYANGTVGTALAEFARRHPALTVDLLATTQC